MIEYFGYNAKRLLLYIDELKTYEAISNINDLMVELFDYAKMMNEISGKFEKYPKNFLTTHRIASRNYTRIKKQFDENKFLNVRDESLEYDYKQYKFIYPKSIEEIKDEAVQQSNCVASYIQRVLDGDCHILFLRKKDSLDKSLVTIEVVKNKIVQARGKFNSVISDSQKEAVDAWNKKYA